VCGICLILRKREVILKNRINKILVSVFFVSLLFFVGCEENSPPVINNLEIIPANPVTSDDLVCEAYVTDEDGNLKSLEFEWFVNDVSVRSEYMLISGSSVTTSDLLTFDFTSPLDVVRCDVTVHDEEAEKAIISADAEIQPYRIHGLNYSPFIDGQNPNWGSIVDESQQRERMQIIAPYTNWIRTFGCSNGLELSGRIAHEFGLKAAIGAWLSKDKNANKKEIKNLIEVAKAGEADVLIVGSEVLLRGDLSEYDLIGYINEVRDEVREAVPDIPVTTADVYSALIAHPEVIKACDVILVNYYPYWEGIHIDRALGYLHGRHQEVIANAKGKKIIVSETGWPSDGNQIGDAVPSLENACFYFINFVSWTRAEGFDYFYFEAFDEQWKDQDEGPQGAHWGVWDKYGEMKSCMLDVFRGLTVEDNWTCKDMPGGPGEPDIKFKYVPPYGSFNNLKGRVLHVWPDEYRVAVYIYVYGGWWTKPYWNRPLTTIECDGSWVCDITTGGIDQKATKIIAYLVPAGYNPPLAYGGSLPKELEEMAVAWVKRNRNPE
jgi:exo-beta-1,3-glucanase (GH17 family)